MENLENEDPYMGLINLISNTYTNSRLKVFSYANENLVKAYWQIGHHIVEFEQNGNTKALYGKGVLEKLSKVLSLRHGKGFSLSNVKRFRQFYLVYPIGAELPRQLNWMHFVELLKIEAPLERSFYEKQTIYENWSTTELIRQKKSELFLRFALNKNKEEVLQLAQKGQKIEKPEDILKDTYIFEFLKIPEPYKVSESKLESLLISKLQEFLLELGKGFAFIGRQYRITLDGQHHYIDLLFYHRILKCFVIIDLKKGEAGYADVGQMNMYLGYMEAEQNTEGDNPPIGIILARSKNELQIKYAMAHSDSQLFVQKYQLYLPNEQELRNEIERIYNEEE